MKRVYSTCQIDRERKKKGKRKKKKKEKRKREMKLFNTRFSCGEN